MVLLDTTDCLINLNGRVRSLNLWDRATGDSAADRAVRGCCGGPPTWEAIEKTYEISRCVLSQLCELRLRFCQLILQRFHLYLQLRLLVKNQVDARLQLVHLDVV